MIGIFCAASLLHICYLVTSVGNENILLTNFMLYIFANNLPTKFVLQNLFLTDLAVSTKSQNTTGIIYLPIILDHFLHVTVIDQYLTD